MGTTTVTLKLDKNKTKVFLDFCREQKLTIGDFFEKAAENEMERLLTDESKAVFRNYGKRKNKAVDFN